jgi:Rrf2 family protein
MLSQKARYAVRALLVLAERKDDTPLAIGDIAEQSGVPKKFLEQILLDLKHRGMVHSLRGKHGGYALSRPAGQIFFAEIIRTIDGPLALSPCASRTAFRKCDECVDEKTCTIRKVLLDVRDASAKILESRSLANLKAEKRAPRKPGLRGA